MRYFTDMLLGACLEVSVILFVEFFYFPKSWVTLLIIGIMVPVMALTIYTLFRYKITKEKPVKDSILKGSEMERRDYGNGYSFVSYWNCIILYVFRNL